ncbi:MAG: ACT domain-containing protein [Elusimicrobia bacterium]|nr:ACT domain-containing protein [Elusimicrobiota bacterium]
MPAEVPQERERVALGIKGVIPMTTVGLLAGLCGALAAAKVPVFVISTYDTDWLLIPAARFAAARSALCAAGHTLRGASPAR